MSRKLLPYAPADMENVWTGGSDVVPCRSGSYAPPNLFTQKVGAGPATPGTTLRAWCALLPDDTAVGYVGTTTKLYQYDGVSTFTDRSRGGGYTIVFGATADWSFAQYGYYTLATDRVDALQVRDSSGVAAFADCAGSPPKARIICSQSEQILLADLNDGTEKGDAFAACGPGDHTDWSSANATTATRIRHRPGKITAMVAFRDYVLAFKRSSIYKLTYTGSTLKWRVELIAIGRGAYGKHDVVNCGDFVVFHGPGGSWTFDGASYRSIADLFGDFTPSNASYFSAISQNAYFFNGGIYKAYNVASDRWGSVICRTATASLAGLSGGVLTGEPAALDTFSNSTVGVSYPDVTWLFTLSTNPSVYVSSVVFGGGTPYANSTSYLLGSFDGLAGKGFPENQVTRFTRLQPKFTTPFPYMIGLTPPGNTDLSLDLFCGSSIFDAATAVVTTVGSSSTAQRRFDINVAAIVAVPKIKFDNDSGYFEISDYKMSMSPEGAF